jgi:D-lactate dehydrogenase
MKEIAIFEAHESDRKYIKQNLEGFKLTFFEECIQDVPIKKFKKAEIISVFIYSKLNSDLIEQLPNLKHISSRSTGYDHIDYNFCAKRKICVSNVPFYGENTVAEHTFALILNLSRKVHLSYLREKNGNFSIDGLQGFDLKGKTLGVIGAGKIGLNTIKIGKGFGMHVKAYDLHQDNFTSDLLHFDYVSVDEILKTSDIVSLHMPYFKATHHFMNKTRLNKMKKGALLINTARGGLIDTDALYDVLSTGKLAGVGLDVIEGEEYIGHEDELLKQKNNSKKVYQVFRDHKIFDMPNVIFTPHNAFNSIEAINRILDTSIDNMKNFGKKDRNIFCVNGINK